MTNWAVLGHFFHGLVFFTLGLTVIFLRYRSRRISLARHLGWLGTFAFGEALYAWYGLLETAPSGTGFTDAFVRPILLGVAYASLLVFGVQTLWSEETYRKRVWSLFLGATAAWLAPYLVGALVFRVELASLAPPIELLIRYLLALPGGILTAVGLRRQSYQALEISLRRRIRPQLRLIELTLVVFGLLNAVLVPYQRALPATRPAGLSLGAASGWIWAAVGAGITLGLGRTLTLIHYEIEQWVEGIERLQALADDRERIGRELHDGIIQSIYAAGLLLESIQPIIPTNPERAQGQLGRVIDSLNNTIQDIRRYIFDLRSDMSDDDLRTGIERLLRDFHVNTLLETEFEVVGAPVEIGSVTRRRHIFQIVREALANTAKHARARWVKVRLDFDTDNLSMTISDDGIGMEKLLVGKGYGLRNIRERTRLLDGTLRIESAPGAGVTYHLTVPYT